MKRLIIAASVAATLTLASVALAAVTLHATYKTTITSSAAGGALKGAWTIKFEHPNYTVTDNGAVVIHGKYTIKGTTITFRDKTGKDVCPGAGKYTINKTGTTLTFTRISDTTACLGRETVLAGTFTKAG
jgi:ABC-type xylose transport system permease subunit